MQLLRNLPLSIALPPFQAASGAAVTGRIAGTLAIAPSGTGNAGNQSLTGQREDANGFMINGGG